jgi:hypothetical protein
MYRDSDRFKWDCGLGQTNLENLIKIRVQTSLANAHFGFKETTYKGWHSVRNATLGRKTIKFNLANLENLIKILVQIT